MSNLRNWGFDDMDDKELEELNVFKNNVHQEMMNYAQVIINMNKNKTLTLSELLETMAWGIVKTFKIVLTPKDGKTH